MENKKLNKDWRSSLDLHTEDSFFICIKSHACFDKGEVVKMTDVDLATGAIQLSNSNNSVWYSIKKQNRLDLKLEDYFKEKINETN